MFYKWSFVSTHEDVLNEHARLDVLLRDLRAISESDAELLQVKQVRVKLAQHLHSLKVRLREHFDTEESGSYMDEIQDRKPSAVDTLTALQAEHPIFLELVSSLEAASQGQDLRLDACHEVLNKLSWMLDLLKHHEERENALIKEVFQS